MNNVILMRCQTLIMAGMVSIIAILSPPALSQKKEEESILIESTITEDVDPLEAVTVEDLKIPVDQLELLVKPLSLEELQTEAAAWFLLLKDKAVEISTAEIAIKRENQIIKEGEEADKAVSKAKEELSKAESALNETTSGTPSFHKTIYPSPCQSFHLFRIPLESP
ncbi:hypothetical protein [Crocosphaera sp.]|uniref:hypothetical protein n=1 Tax=Crocosphaera sp. TaxID=2729996 RepID=UPI00260CA5DB|nr:hypothetical protein [Crocosphaera sp.]MDJ0581182.1 hypothetical protein [Crocosphaera sp.]